MKVFDLLNATIDTAQVVTPTPTPVPTPVPTPTIDWSAQNLVDSQQQLEIDALKVELAQLKSATPITTETTTPIRIKNTNTYGRRFNG